MECKNRPYSYYGAIRAIVEKGKGDALAVVDKQNTFTFRELACAADYYAQELKNRGIGKGSHVALWAVNSAGWLISFLAITKIGAVAVLCNYSLTSEELEPLMRKTETQFILFGDSRELKRNESAPFQLGEKLGIDSARIFSLEAEDFRAAAAKTPLDEAFVELTEQESKTQPGFIIFTTGTTSEPKAVLLAQYGLLTDNLNYPTIMPGFETKRTCIAVPLFHVMALLSTFNFLANGCPAVVLDAFTVDNILKMGSEHKVTTLTTVGTVHLKLIEDPRFKESLAKTVTNIGSGGGALTEAQFLRIETAYDNARLINGYGQTEASALIAVASPADPLERRTSSVGRIYPGKDVRIKDPNKGYLETGEVGEIVVRNGGNLMLRYYGLPAEDQPFDADGDLHTGDLGFLDEDGYLHLAGRIKDIIIKGGENISPFEIERALTGVENIRDAKVIGVPSAVYGENIEAAVTCIDQNGFDEAKIKEALRGVLGAFKIPAHILFFEDFPLNENNKIDQRSLKLDMARKLRRIYLEEELTAGIVLFETRLKNVDFLIVPVADMVQSAAEILGFSRKRALNIRLSCEEMLTERIVNAFIDVGNIDISVILMPGLMRVRFADNGMEYDIHKDEKTNLSARLILKHVDGFTTVAMTENKKAYCMDFVLNESFDMEEFLLSHRKE